MNYLDVINEGLIHQVFDQEMIQEAVSQLQAGKVVARIFYPPDELAAVWENRPNAPQMGIRVVGNEMMFRCTCRTFSRESICEHIATLLVAWARERSTFDIIDEDEAMDDEPDEDDEIFFFDDEEDFERPIRSRHSEPAVSTIARKVENFDPLADYRTLLGALTMPELREVARLRNVPVSGQRKDPILDALALALAQPGKLSEDWPKLSPQARLVAGLIPFIGPQMYPKQLHQMAQQAGLKGEKAFNEALEELRHFGILYITNYGAIQYPATLPLGLPPDPDFLSIPILNAHGLRIQAAPDPRAFYQSVLRLVLQFQSPGDPYLVRSDEHERNLSKKLPFLSGWPLEVDGLEQISRSPYPLQAIRQRGVRVAPQPSILANDARMRLAGATGLSPEQVDFIVRLLIAPDPEPLKPGKPLNVQQDTLVGMVQAGAWEIANELFAVSINNQIWSELDFLLAQPKKFRWIVNDHTGRPYPWLLGILASLRVEFVTLIRRLPAGRWYAIDAIAKKAQDLGFGNAFTALSSVGYFEIDGQKAHLNEPDDQRTLLRAYLEALLTGPFYWQGVVDLGWKGDNLAGFCISGFGASLLGQERGYHLPEPPAGQPAIAFLADGAIKINLEAMPGDVLALLSMLGNVETTRQGAIVYRPTLLGASRVFEAGWTSERILDHLAQAAQQPAPQKLSEMLNHWWSNFGGVQMYQNVALIELGDDYALNEMLAGTSLSRYLLYRFNARLVAISPEGVESLRDELVKKGYTPKFAD